MAVLPFRAMAGETVSISVSAASQRVQVAPTGTTGQYSLLVTNAGTATVWIDIGDSTVTSAVQAGGTAGSMPILAGSSRVFTAAGTYVSAIAAGATGSIYFTLGEGF